MDIKQTILEILNEIKPTVNLEGVTDIIDSSFLDSMELMGLIAALAEKFEFEIDIDWIVPENFNSVDAMVAMVEKITSEK